MEHDDSNRDIRDAVVTLESKMELMSDSIAKLASSVEKMIEVKGEIRQLASDLTHMEELNEIRRASCHESMAKVSRDVHNAWATIRELQDFQKGNSIFIGAFERLAWIIITGVIGAVFFMLQSGAAVH